MLNDNNTYTNATPADQTDVIAAAIHTEVHGQVAAEVVRATVRDDGTGELLLAAPIEPAGLALIQARLQPTPRARIAWKMAFGAMGMSQGEDITHAVGKVVLVTCSKSRDEWGTWYINTIRRWNMARPEQIRTCKTALDKVRPQLEKLNSHSDDDQDDQAIAPQEPQNPAALDNNEYELPF